MVILTAKKIFRSLRSRSTLFARILFPTRFARHPVPETCDLENLRETKIREIGDVCLRSVSDHERVEEKA